MIKLTSWQVEDHSEEGVKEYFLEHCKERPPNCYEGSVLVLRHEGRVVGVAALQSVLHLEPVHILAEYRGVDPIAQLSRMAKSLAKGYRGVFITCSSNRVAKLLQFFGMQEMQWRTFKWSKKGSEL